MATAQTVQRPTRIYLDEVTGAPVLTMTTRRLLVYPDNGPMTEQVLVPDAAAQARFAYLGSHHIFTKWEAR